MNNQPALVYQTGDNPWSEPMIVYFTDVYMGRSASMSWYMSNRLLSAMRMYVD